MLNLSKIKLKGRAKLNLLSIEDLKYKNKFNYVFSVDAFHHYFNKKTAIKNIYRALKNEGQIILVDIHFGNFLNKIFHVIEPGNTGVYSPFEIKEILRKNQFKNITQIKLDPFTFMTFGKKIK